MSSSTPTAGYTALRESAAWLDLSTRGWIAALGADRLRLLHAIASNSIENLAPGQGAYAFFLNAQGRIQADSRIFVAEDRVLIDCEPEARQTLVKHIESYIIMDDVRLEDLTDSHAAVALEGPRSQDIARKACGDVLPAGGPYSHGESQGMRILRSTLSGQEGLWFYCSAGRRTTLVENLEGAGAVAATAEDFRVVRVENRLPRFGEDYSGSNIPHETGLLHAISFSKGCYLGQEIVERVRARGQVNKLLVSLELDGLRPPEPGAAVLHANQEVGRLTSPVFSPRRGVVLAFAILRREAAVEGAGIAAGGVSGKVVTLS
jgi:folate-binding protein YgfZ